MYSNNTRALANITAALAACGIDTPAELDRIEDVADELGTLARPPRFNAALVAEKVADVETVDDAVKLFRDTAAEHAAEKATAEHATAVANALAYTALQRVYAARDTLIEAYQPTFREAAEKLAELVAAGVTDKTTADEAIKLDRVDEYRQRDQIVAALDHGIALVAALDPGHNQAEYRAARWVAASDVDPTWAKMRPVDFGGGLYPWTPLDEVNTAQPQWFDLLAKGFSLRLNTDSERDAVLAAHAEAERAARATVKYA